jgi:hypothetical protein
VLECVFEHWPRQLRVFALRVDVTGLVRRWRNQPDWRANGHGRMALTRVVVSLLMSESVFRIGRDGEGIPVTTVILQLRFSNGSYPR